MSSSFSKYWLVVACTHEVNVVRLMPKSAVNALGRCPARTSSTTAIFHPEPRTRSRGCQAAAPFVTGAIILLWSEFPEVRATHTKSIDRSRKTDVIEKFFVQVGVTEDFPFFVT